MQIPIKILFLCTGNSCRSIIAEGLANQLGDGRVQAFSAGSQPSGKVNDNALAVLARHGIEMAEPTSQSWDEYENIALDLVITVCDSAANESCPVWLGDAVKAHWGVVDPADVGGSQAQINAAFERTYNEMQSRITALLSLSFETMSAQELADAATKIQQASV